MEKHRRKGRVKSNEPKENKVYLYKAHFQAVAQGLALYQAGDSGQIEPSKLVVLSEIELHKNC